MALIPVNIIGHNFQVSNDMKWMDPHHWVWECACGATLRGIDENQTSGNFHGDAQCPLQVSSEQEFAEMAAQSLHEEGVQSDDIDMEILIEHIRPDRGGTN